MSKLTPDRSKRPRLSKGEVHNAILHALPPTLPPRSTCRACLGVFALLATVSLWLTSRAPTTPATSRAFAALPRPKSALGSSAGFANSPDFTQCLARLRAEPPGDFRTAHLARFLIGESHRDPTLVARAILRERDVAFRQTCLAAFVDGWAAQFPSEAAAWLLNAPSPERRQWAATFTVVLAEYPSALSEFIPRLIGGDRDAAAEYLRMALDTLADVGNFSLAWTFTELTRDPLSRGPLREQLVSDWARVNAPAAAAWVRTLVDSPERDGLLGRLVETWSAAEPLAAANYAAALPDGLGRTHALTLALTAWTARDVVAASTWLASRADSAELDTPIFALATHPALAVEHPFVAATWAESISNPDVRLQGLRAVLEQWSTQDPAAARKFLLATPALSEQFRRTLLEEIDRG